MKGCVLEASRSVTHFHFHKLADKKRAPPNGQAQALLCPKLLSEDPEDAEDLEERSLEFYALSLTDSIWVSRVAADDKLPWLKEEKRLKKDQFIQKEDSLGVYLVAIKEVLHRNDVAPKSYVIPTIRQMILHNRKLELMNEIEKTLVIDAINNKQFEQY